MATLDELTNTLKNAANAHATAAIETDLINCLDLLIEAAAEEPESLIQVKVPAQKPPFTITKLECALSSNMGATPATPTWIEDFRKLVAKVRAERGIPRPKGR